MLGNRFRQKLNTTKKSIRTRIPNVPSVNVPNINRNRRNTGRFDLTGNMRRNRPLGCLGTVTVIMILLIIILILISSL